MKEQTSITKSLYQCQELINQIEADEVSDEQLQEISNIENATDYIENSLQPGQQITNTMICEVHRLIVDGLTEEGDPMPGAYRNCDVQIARSDHTPPNHAAVRARKW